MRSKAIIVLSLVIFSVVAWANEPSIEKIQVKNNPAEVGKKVADNVINRRFGWRYQRACAYYGSLIFSDVTNDPAILKKESGERLSWLFKRHKV